MSKSKWVTNDINHERTVGIFKLCVWPVSRPPFQAWMLIDGDGDSLTLPDISGYKTVAGAKRGIEACFRKLLREHLAKLDCPTSSGDTTC